METISNHIDTVLKSLEYPIKDKPITDYEQGVMYGRFKLAQELKALLKIN